MGTQKIALKSDRDDIEAIISFIEAAGFPMDHFPESEESREFWQFDGDLDGIQILVYPRLHGRLVTFEIWYPGGETEAFDDTAKDWINDFGEDFLSAIADWK